MSMADVRMPGAEVPMTGLNHWHHADAADLRPAWQRVPYWLLAVIAHLGIAALFLVTLNSHEEKPADDVQVEMVAPPAPPQPQPVEPVKVEQHLKPQPIKQLVMPRPPMFKPDPTPPVAASVPEMVMPQVDPPPPPPPATAAAPPTTYLSALYAHLAANKRYPRAAQKAHVEGTALLRFKMNHQGRVLSFKLDRGSGHEVLDTEVLEMIQRAQPLPAPPADMPDPVELVIPVQFSVH